MNEILSSTKILETSITTASKSDILKYIFKRLQNRNEKFYIVTPNPEMLVHASRSNGFRAVLNAAAVGLPDGIGVLVSGNILKKGIKSRITGMDFMLDLCQESAKEALSIGLLGGRDGVAEKTAECLLKKYPRLIINYIGEEWSDQKSNIKYQPHQQATNYQLQTSRHTDILFVAYGFPKQEEWISKNLPKIDVTCAMGVGGSFDYISGKVPRAPRIVRWVGLEWAFRLVVQPWRIKRQMSLPIFLYKVLRERITSSKV